MKKLLFLIPISMLFSMLLYGQQGQTPVTPLAKCIIPFIINSTGLGPTGANQPSVTGYDNRQTGCSNWSVVYSSTVYTVVALELQSAPALSNAAPGTPGTYVAFAGSVVTGINPNTATTQAASTFSGYYPWIRLKATTITGAGTIVGVLIGTLPIDVTGGSSGTSGCVGTAATPCVVDGPDATGVAPTQNPVAVAGVDGNSGAIVPFLLTTLGKEIIASLSSGIADGLNNDVALLAQVNSPGGDVPLATFPFVFNGATWDKTRGNVSGLFVQGPGASGSPIVGSPIRIGAKDVAGNTQGIFSSTAGVLATLNNFSGSDGFSNSDLGLNVSDTGGVKLQQNAMYNYNGATWDRIRGDTTGLRISTSNPAIPLWGLGVTGAAVPANAQYVGANGSGNMKGIIGCDNSAFLDMSTATTTQIIALSGSLSVYICSIAMEAGGTTTATLKYGTGSNCVTGTTSLGAAWEWTTQTGISRGSGLGMLYKTPASQAVCITNSQAVNLHVEITYTQF